MLMTTSATVDGPDHLDTTDDIVSTLAVIVSRKGQTMSRAQYQFPLLVKELPVPPDFLPRVAELRAKSRRRSERDLQQFDEGIRLRIHFGGMHVACVSTPDGTKVIAAGYPGTGEMRAALSRFREHDNTPVRIEAPAAWDELVGAAGTVR